MSKRFFVAALLAALLGCAPARAQMEGAGYRTWPGNLASLLLQGQLLEGGANVQSKCAINGSAYGSCVISGGTVTIHCEYGPLQYLTSGGAFTLDAPGGDSSCIVMLVNNSSAGTVTFSGFTVGSSTGSSLTTTNSSVFSLSAWRITPGIGATPVAGYDIFAHQ